MVYLLATWVAFQAADVPVSVRTSGMTPRKANGYPDPCRPVRDCNPVIREFHYSFIGPSSGMGVVETGSWLPGVGVSVRAEESEDSPGFPGNSEETKIRITKV